MARRVTRAAALAAALLVCLWAGRAVAQPAPPPLTQPVNDFANVIDPQSARTLDALIRSLQRATGDVVVVATVDTFKPYATIDEYAVKMFENGGRGVGEKGRDNGLLVVVAVNDRRVRVEVGYELEQFITDGFAGQVRDEELAPQFRQGNYGAGLVAGVQRLVGRIAQGRNVSLQELPQEPRTVQRRRASGGGAVFWLFIAFIVIRALVSGIGRNSRRGPPSWGGPGWGGWSSGVGPFIGRRGGFGGGGFGGGGFGGGGGGFGGFGGGRSGGGGASGGW
ncbi:MAG TPA: TPM domain-containing protein [Vicinamibacterales bacterium]|nr:TPM domain-containing protein [Vicinamibacterales bacterium]